MILFWLCSRENFHYGLGLDTCGLGLGLAWFDLGLVLGLKLNGLITSPTGRSVLCGVLLVSI